MLQYDVQKFLKKFVVSTSQNEDDARREFILNVLLLGIVILSFSAFVISLIGHSLDGLDASMPVSIILIILTFFVFLYFLSRRGLLRLSSYGLLIAFFLPVTYQIYMLGADIPAALLAYVVIIFISGILINKSFTFIATATISLALTSIGFLQIYNIIYPNLYWKIERITVPDIIIFVLLLFIIATVSWLSNREIEKSLARARKSEAELKKERDSLEITVEKRTRELKETQAEKMIQLYRFAEFGRLSSGLFHDLINPLTAVSLNMEKVKNTRQSAYPHIEFAIQNTDVASISETTTYLDKAIIAAKKMEDMVIAVRKQLSRQETKTNFLLKEEIESVIEVLLYKARKAGVAMRLFSHQKIKTYGDAVKFSQVALNLVANAIDSYLEKRDGETQTITMSLSQEGGMIIFEVKDGGIGISEENKPRLFEPFFTTKEEGYGLGIGLSIAKRIIENDFDGSIDVASKEGEGSTFIVKFPQKQNE